MIKEWVMEFIIKLMVAFMKGISKMENVRKGKLKNK